jgi:hypothetical protein
MAVRRVPRGPDTDDAFGVTDGLGRDNIAGSFFKHVQAAFVRAHALIMPACGHRSSCRHVCSALPTFARYPAGLAKARVRKPDGRKSKAPADDPIARDDGSVLPPKKPPMSSVKQRWRKAKLRKLK